MSAFTVNAALSHSCCERAALFRRCRFLPVRGDDRRGAGDTIFEDGFVFRIRQPQAIERIGAIFAVSDIEIPADGRPRVITAAKINIAAAH